MRAWVLCLQEWLKNNRFMEGREQSPLLNRHFLFIVSVLILLILPLQSIRSLDVPLDVPFDTSFWGREELMNSYSRVRYFLGDRLYFLSVIGKDNWLMYTGENSLNDYQNYDLFTPEELAKIQIQLDSEQKNLAKKNIKFFVVVPPNKNTIYSEYMPPEIGKFQLTSRLDQVIENQKKHGKTQILDLRPALMAEKKLYDVYQATDTHWNPYGAYVGYREILMALKKDFPALNPHPLEDFQYESKGSEIFDLSRLGHINNEEESFSLTLNSMNEVSSVDFTGTDGVGVIMTSTDDPDLPVALVYRDSFTIQLLPFLSLHFSQAAFFWSSKFNDQYIDLIKPDVVLFEITERYLENLLTIK